MADTGLTVEQAQQLLAGSPTQQELFLALVTLAQDDEVSYVAALPRAVELLEQQNPGQTVSREQVNQVVRQLQGQVEGQEVTLGDTEAAPPVPQTELDALAGTTGTTGPPPVPPEEDDTFQPPPFIGNVPEGFGASVISHPAQRVETIGGPRYRAGDEWDPARLSPREVRRRQKELERAGLLEPGSYVPGFWDKASADALNVAMGHANIRGSDVEDVIQELASLRPSQRDQVEEFIPPPEMKPDPAEITQIVKRAFRSRLGREPTDEELADYGGFLRGRFAAQHDVEVARQRAAFEARQQGVTPEVAPSVISHPAQPIETVGGVEGGEAGMPTLTGVNPIQAFFDRMDRLEGSELEFARDQEATFQASQRVMDTLAGLGRRIGR